MKKIILASGSPRRKELLTQIGIDFVVDKSDVEEIVPEDTPVFAIPMILANQKAMDVLKRRGNTDEIVLGADTIVSIGDKILGKPKNEQEAFDMLRQLSGSVHSVFTGVSLCYFDEEIIKSENFYVETKVHVIDIEDEEIRDYIATGDPMDKAGAYGIQGYFARYISGIEGDYYNVVGLPVSGVYENIKKILTK